MRSVIDGFWLPQKVRDQVLAPDTEFTTLSFRDGRPCQPDDEGAITARWPLLRPSQWKKLLAVLLENRQHAPSGLAYWDRFRTALSAVEQRFANPSDPLRIKALKALPGYTGFSEAMIRHTLGALDMMSIDQLPAAFSLSPTIYTARRWQPMEGLPGLLRFFDASPLQRILRRLPGRGDRSIFGPSTLPDLVVGYGAGNVPGTALLISLLAQAAALTGSAPPAVVVKNSRREPIFTPLVLHVLEAADPDLVSSIAVLIWDYEELAVQELLLLQADLVVAAASDDTIAQIRTQIESCTEMQDISQVASASTTPTRFHAHGHKVSFSAIGRDVLGHQLVDDSSGQPLLDIVTLLAALDSAFWDQYGCLSSRVHFIEDNEERPYTSIDYATRLTEQMRLLEEFLPRGAWPRQQLHDRFDRYKLLEMTGQVQVLSKYDDKFLVVIDERPLNANTFHTMVNDCQGRVVIVRPIADLMELPNKYLKWMQANNLQSLSVAVGQAGEGLTPRFLRFAEACGVRGVTAIRTVGRGAFPQLSHSWDGLIPLDLVRRRPAGRFTTIEFDAPYEQMIETYNILLRRGLSQE